MTNPERAVLPYNWRDVFAEQTAELEKHFRGSYDLGVSPNDLASLLRPMGYKTWWSINLIDAPNEKTRTEINEKMLRQGTVSDSRLVIDSFKMRDFILDKRSPLSYSQQKALTKISNLAMEFINAPAEPFERGYKLYMKLVKANDKLPGGFDLSAEEMQEQSFLSDDGEQRIDELVILAQSSVPLLANYAHDRPDLFRPYQYAAPNGEQNYFDINAYTKMIQAGIGLAYWHCFTQVHDSAMEAETAYQAQNQA